MPLPSASAVPRLVAAADLPDGLAEAFVGGPASLAYLRGSAGPGGAAWGFAALSGEALLGSVSLKGHPAPVAHESVGYLRLAVGPEHRRAGLGSLLLQRALEAALSGLPCLRVLAYPEAEELDAARPFLERHGFTETAGVRNYRAALAAPSPLPTVAGLAVRPYRGGEPGLDAALLSLYRRAFRGHAEVPAPSLADFQRQLAWPHCRCLLLQQAEEPVGLAIFSLEGALCSVDFLFVARSHWGSGGADLLVGAIQRAAIDGGCREIASAAAATNRASCALIERTAPGPGRSWVTPRFTRLCLRGS